MMIDNNSSSIFTIACKTPTQKGLIFSTIKQTREREKGLDTKNISTDNDDIQKISSKEEKSEKNLIQLKIPHNNKTKKSFVCQFCEKIFKEKGNLKTHLRIHTDERPYKCQFNQCSMAFKTSGQLREHEKTHYNIRPFKCIFCNGSFSRLATLKTHLKSTSHREILIKHELEGNYKTFSQFDDQSVKSNPTPELKIESYSTYFPSKTEKKLDQISYNCNEFVISSSTNDVNNPYEENKYEEMTFSNYNENIFNFDSC